MNADKTADKGSLRPQSGNIALSLHLRLKRRNCEDPRLHEIGRREHMPHVSLREHCFRATLPILNCSLCSVQNSERAVLLRCMLCYQLKPANCNKTWHSCGLFKRRGGSDGWRKAVNFSTCFFIDFPWRNWLSFTAQGMQAWRKVGFSLLGMFIENIFIENPYADTCTVYRYIIFHL